MNIRSFLRWGLCTELTCPAQTGGQDRMIRLSLLFPHRPPWVHVCVYKLKCVSSKVIRPCVQKDGGSRRVRWGGATWRPHLSSAGNWRGKVVFEHLRCCSKSIATLLHPQSNIETDCLAFFLQLCAIACMAADLFCQEIDIWKHFCGCAAGNAIWFKVLHFKFKASSS